jgi:geranylgeranyl pyrophosphate synthase
VNSIIETGETSEQNKQILLSYVIETEGLEKSYKTAEEYSKKARDALNKIEKELKLNTEQIHALEALREITYFVLNRKN